MSKTIVDVRTPGEYRLGHTKGSINIPLDEIPARLDDFKKLQRPLVLCCASGNRSGKATIYLNSIGIHCENGGSWLNIL